MTATEAWLFALCVVLALILVVGLTLLVRHDNRKDIESAQRVATEFGGRLVEGSPQLSDQPYRSLPEFRIGANGVKMRPMVETVVGNAQVVAFRARTVYSPIADLAGRSYAVMTIPGLNLPAFAVERYQLMHRGLLPTTAGVIRSRSGRQWRILCEHSDQQEQVRRLVTEELCEIAESHGVDQLICGCGDSIAIGGLHGDRFRELLQAAHELLEHPA